jgi:wyosine [tRNA(Phe)-imidazoG37] synthetase (radical SAM superfamily)
MGRRDFYPPDLILGEIEKALEERPRPDVLTLAGSGEPTLYRSLGALVCRIRSLTPLPVVLLTGGGTLMLDDVAADAVTVDVLAPSLDASTQEQFDVVNRPCGGIRFQNVVDGLARTLNQFHGLTRLEVMLVPGVNDGQESLTGIAALTRSLRLAAIDLNTPVRPAHATGVAAAPAEVLRDAIAAFGPLSRAIGQFSGLSSPRVRESRDLNAIVAETLARRPCTLQDLVAALACEPVELTKVIDSLLLRGVVEERRSRDEVYFWAPMDSAEGASAMSGKP